MSGTRRIRRALRPDERALLVAAIEHAMEPGDWASQLDSLVGDGKPPSHYPSPDAVTWKTGHAR